jgi:hypothetical protein
MNHYRITYSINANNERVYPAKMKGVVFVMTQDHPTENFMVGSTEAKLVEDGKTIVALTADATGSLVKELQDAYPKPTQELSLNAADRRADRRDPQA